MKSPTAEKSFSLRNYGVLVGLCTWILIVHFCGLFLFTRGFLLTRLVLENKSSCGSNPTGNASGDGVHPSCWSTSRPFEKAVFVIIDALRFDFTIPIEVDPDTHNHNRLTAIHHLLEREPQNALLFEFIADPPTTTLQRLKALTAGTLPTFIDAGRNFAGTAIEEDNLVDQLISQGKRVAFMGDDTWIKLFPNAFLVNHTHPYESFNTRDLYTVDNGVNKHLFPALTNGTGEWDVLIAHYLGVDHAGHTYGSSNAFMAEKLREMNSVLDRLFSLVDKDTIVFVMGDHGMDLKGDHGGESALEVESALFAYSKRGLSSSPTPIGPRKRTNGPLDSSLKQLDNLEGLQKIYETKYHGYRTIPQLDLVPSVSLLLGIPIPFNNLGQIIPELFYGNGKQLVNAARVNAHQIHRYIVEYSLKEAGKELSHALPLFQKEFDAAESAYQRVSETYFPSDGDWQKCFILYSRYMRLTLEACRQIWAQFDDSLMISGLIVLGSSILCLALHAVLPIPMVKYNERAFGAAIAGAVIGAALGECGIITKFIHSLAQSSSSGRLDGIVFGLAEGSIVGFLVHACISKAPLRLLTSIYNCTFDGVIAILIILTQVALFGSNSYTVWEDFAVAALAQTFGFLALIKAFTIREAHLRNRLLFFSVCFIVLVRISHYSTLCREEQLPYCSPTFYASATSSNTSLHSLAILLLVVVTLPWAIRRVLNITASFTGIAEAAVTYVFQLVLIMIGAYWSLDTIDHMREGGDVKSTPEVMRRIKNSKMWIARAVIGLSILAIPAWAASPLCLSTKVVENEAENTKSQVPSPQSQVFSSASRRVYVYGFANSFGAPYVVYMLAIFSMVMLTYKPMGGVMISILLLQIICALEIFDTKRDATISILAEKAGTTFAIIQQTRIPETQLGNMYPSVNEVTILALLGSVSFFSTGHQAVLSSIDWNSASIGFEGEDIFPFGPILVSLNTLGAHTIAALALPLLALWKISPRRDPQQPLISHLTRTVMLYAMYHAALTTSASGFAAYFRRHLMVWKVFAPRFMLGGVTLLMVDVTIAIVAVGIGCLVVLKNVNSVFEFGFI